MSARTWLVWGKRIFLGVSVAAIVMTAASDDGGDAVAVADARVRTQPAVRTVMAPQRSPEEAHVELERLARVPAQQEGEGEIGNVFGATSWYVPPPPPPPPPPAKPAPPPKPTAPPLPYSYLGQYEEDAKLVIMLVKGDRLHIVAEGDTIENTYRVERVSAGMVELTYLPLNIKQSLSTGAKS